MNIDDLIERALCILAFGIGMLALLSGAALVVSMWKIALQ